MGTPRSGTRQSFKPGRLLCVELDGDGTACLMHYPPYLDHRPLAEGEPTVEAILERPESASIDREVER